MRLHLTALINNYVKLIITFINVTCTIELKIDVSWNNTPLDYSVRVIYPHVANEIIERPGFLDWVVSCSILKDRYLRLLSDLEFGIELYLEVSWNTGTWDYSVTWISGLSCILKYLERQIPEIIEWPGVRNWVVSWSILNYRYLRLLRDLDFWIELYLVVSWMTDNWDYWAT